ncbi:MAG TPA: ATP-binding protein [Ktedonobacteraceae bacterium]|nr:ATP-binding protein [Ktedonobacteraceae bacterium]
MYFSKVQIEQSLKRLNELNPFFGTVFLAFKEVDLPVGETKNLNFLPILEAFLQKYYRPVNRYAGFYTPFKTSNKKKRWNTYQYANTLHRIAVDTFSDVILHPKSTREWGWKADYVETLAGEHLAISLIPTFDLAVWLFRTRNWPGETGFTDVVETFLTEFRITEEEKVLFNTASPAFNTAPLLQEVPLELDSLLEVIGLPPGEGTRVQEYRVSALFSIFDTLAEYGAKLQYLKMHEIGLCNEIEFEPATRLNIITGDNALGKTFLLECTWWALTDTWASKYPAYPPANAKNPSITFQIGKNYQEEKKQTVKYNWRGQSWPPVKNRSVLPGLSIFSQADGSFAIWDPAKLEDLNKQSNETDAFIRISPTEVWNGVRIRRDNGKEVVLCRGLLEDWITWQESSNEAVFNHFSQALQELSPHPKYPLIPGEPMRIPDEERDVRRVPTLEFPYGTVPVLFCSAGIKRIVALAYLIVWAWNEHVIGSQLNREEPQRSIVLLIDEMEAHLHPFWQRVIVPAIMRVVQALSQEVDTQIFVATHSPLVLASVEPLFHAELDKLFHLYLDYEDGTVILDDVPFVKRGRVDQWLTSDIFGLAEPRSRDAELTIEVARELQLADEEPSKERVQEISNELKRVLAPDDEFWPLWIYFAQGRGVDFDAY